jgi:hypothetical protein
MKRNCIFTNKPANSKFTIGSDKQNWAKSAPCTKEYLADRGDKPPTELEIRLVELFYEQELCRLRIEQYSTQMDEIRALISNKSPIQPLVKPEVYGPSLKMPKEILPIELTQEDIDWLNAQMGPLETTAEETKEALEEIGFEEGLRIPDNPERFVGLKEQTEEECPNPKCSSMLLNAPGIGPFCPNKECDVFDGPDVRRPKELTEEEKPVKVEKKVVKKKPGNLWD